MSASGDLKNALNAERRHSQRRVDWGHVELSAQARKYLQDEDADPALIVECRETEEAAAAKLRSVPHAVSTGLTPEEAKVLELMQAGERKTDAYATVLEVSHLSFKEQQREVKRAKDKLKKRLERAGAKYE
jgi:hypothetical protein